MAIVVVLSWDRLFDRDRWLAGSWRPGPVAAAVAGAVVGALPWLYTNIGSRFASLQTGSLPSYRGLGYGARLRVFFDDMLPVQLGVRTVPGGAWVGGHTVGPVLYGVVAAVVVVVVVAALGSARRGRVAAPALAASVGIVVFPFLYSARPVHRLLGRRPVRGVPAGVHRRRRRRRPGRRPSPGERSGGPAR